VEHGHRSDGKAAAKARTTQSDRQEVLNNGAAAFPDHQMLGRPP
jgi:hypothetical protein